LNKALSKVPLACLSPDQRSKNFEHTNTISIDAAQELLRAPVCSLVCQPRVGHASQSFPQNVFFWKMCNLFLLLYWTRNLILYQKRSWSLINSFQIKLCFYLTLPFYLTCSIWEYSLLTSLPSLLKAKLRPSVQL